MGIGIFLVWPLAKKFGKRNVTMIGFLIYAIGSAICWIFPSNMTLVLVGQFIKNIGGLPCAYVFMALFADALDNIEWRTGFRADGAAMSIYNIIAVAMVGVCTGIFNLGLSNNGYIKPVTLENYLSNPNKFIGLVTQLSPDKFANLKPDASIAFIQNDGVNNFFTFSFVGLEVITGLLCALILLFVNVEKTINKKQFVLVEREKELFKNEGKEWLPAEERNALEIARQEEESEKIFIQELKEKCKKLSLDFDKEYEKHLLNKKAKKDKEMAKETKNKEKQIQKANKKLYKINEEKRIALEE